MTVLRLAVTVRGVVQGVGFRPFVYCAATERGLAGWVRNLRDGVCLEVQGPEPAVQDFLAALRQAPPAARVERVEAEVVAPVEGAGFSILESTGAEAVSAPVAATIPADQALCAACREEVATPGARRYGYPFTNCTRCGPRYTIIESLPYDRERTSMKGFAMCAACAAEYHDPRDRRFHAQPIACPACGPVLRLVAGDGSERRRGRDAIQGAQEALAAGQVVALMGVGGFQLLVDATSDAAVARLRRRKRREAKPFGVMFPSIEALRAVCAVTDEEAAALGAPEAPMVLVRRLPAEVARRRVAEAVAPGNPRLGALLPYSPLHVLLLEAVGGPVVCTSGNLSEEPMCTGEAEARERLGTVADVFLVHDRPIVRPVDDSVARVGPEGIELLRRARGFAPLALRLAGQGASPLPCVLALGGQLKNTVALVMDGGAGEASEVVVSQHLGDLSSVEGALLCERSARDLVRFFAARPAGVACDLHPDYAATRLAERLAAEWEVPLVRVQHHHAHVAAVMAEVEAEVGLAGPVLGLAWDGAGLGSDGTIWGGEALLVEDGGAEFRRVAHLRPFSLPGGERAMREPRRAALGLLHEILGGAAAASRVVEAAGEADALGPDEARLLVALIERGLQAPRTTSMGRLFDGVAALAGLRGVARFEGEAAMELEFAAEGAGEEEEGYPLPLVPSGSEGPLAEPAMADWEPLVRAVLRDRDAGVPRAAIALRFHRALVDLAEALAVRVGVRDVVLAGGCFQNLRLLREVRARLVQRGFAVHAPRRYPPNDGSLSLGQALVAVTVLKNPTCSGRSERNLGSLIPSPTSKEVRDVSRHTG
ncbi:MAG TPA: carbamoyltransferase HypF [Polyangia bacterium]|nr:carbamoyltransferase HypF [Polyangia bacterium]